MPLGGGPGGAAVPARHALTRCRRARAYSLHLSTQCKRFLWDKGYLGGVKGVFTAGLEGVFRRLGDVLSVRNGSG